MRKAIAWSVPRILSVILVLGVLHATPARAADLVSLLTGQLGVTQAQAAGGAGSLLNYAKGKLSATDFTKVTNALPDVTKLIASAPKASSGSSGMMGQMSSMFGGGPGGTSSLGGLATVASQFKSLGLSSGMIDKFIPVILQYAQSQGGQQVMQLLKGALLG